MTRRLLTFLALLTGLAALATPGSASILEACDCEIGVAEVFADLESNEDTTCPESGVDGQKREPGKKASPNKRTRRVFRPPVLFGVDRAHE